jgi:hypothetical protein
MLKTEIPFVLALKMNHTCPVLHFDGDFYERRKSVLPIFSGEAKNLITSLRKI